ncbi:MAG: IclR family transcriptional regulator C-terminal domain-containing protein [Kiritimatiellae bacterium]|nr:IclR family transcriptional regulator C-terminal domain-containing protein [Kiritimatiellia bacterium]MDD5522922.1 IclR family transcriptional regulator C-terminal domain-containing protein [Kiritimatiellia bacterium]
MRNQALYKTALPFMTKLSTAFSETVGLAVLDGKTPDGIIIGQVQGTQRFSFRLAVDQHFPLHTGAPGKAIVAFLPLKQQKEIISRMTFTKFNQRTITTSKAFFKEIETIRRNGYATDIAEEVEGCHCIGAPIMDQNRFPIAAVWVTGPSNRLPISKFEHIARFTITAADNISSALKKTGETQIIFMKHKVGEAEKYIKDKLSEPLEMENVAKELHIGYSSLRHWFKRIHGKGPAQYHLQLRLDAAKKLLRSSRKTVAVICRELGYEDQNYFSALFKKKTGMAPLAYREKNT